MSVVLLPTDNPAATAVDRRTRMLRTAMGSVIGELEYRHAGHVIIGRDANGAIVRELIWVDD